MGLDFLCVPPLTLRTASPPSMSDLGLLAVLGASSHSGAAGLSRSGQGGGSLALSPGLPACICLGGSFSAKDGDQAPSVPCCPWPVP